MGRWIRHGTYYPRYLLKLFRKSSVMVDDSELMDHHFYIKSKTGKLFNDLIEENLKENNLSFWLQKHDRYSSLQAAEVFINTSSDRKHSNFANSQDARRLWIKRHIWNKMPLLVRPFIYFFIGILFAWAFFMVEKD